jgi:Tfp pilus assembly protein PilX
MSKYSAPLRTRKGFALIALLGFILVGVLLTIARSRADITERARRISKALAKAKEHGTENPAKLGIRAAYW